MSSFFLKAVLTILEIFALAWFSGPAMMDLKKKKEVEIKKNEAMQW